MYACLYISEIVARICSELAADDDSFNYMIRKQYAGTLAALAMTCRALHDPALDALWKIQRDITPLLRCMPSDLWEERLVEDVKIYLYPRRLIVPTDWCRLQVYAHRIKYLGSYNRPRLQGAFSATPSNETLRTLHNSMPRSMSLLCPNVHGIFWDDIIFNPDNESFQYLHLFLGPHTRHLRLLLDGADMGRLSLLPSLPRTSPGITHVNFLCNKYDEPFSENKNLLDAVSATLCQWNQLESVCSPNSFPPHLWKHLACLPKLQEISTSIPNDVINLLHSFPQPAFPALRILKLSVENLSTCTTILNLIQSPRRLRTITCDFREDPDMEMEHIFQTISTCCSHLLLTTLTIQEHVSSIPTIRWTIEENMLKPLLAFTNITTIHIFSSHPFNLGNEVLREMATAWPHLQSMKLSSEMGWAGQSRITLAGIVPLLSIPTLTNLDIVVNASIVDHTPDMPLLGVSNTQIQYLDLGDSLIKDSHLVAAFLSEVLPNVRHISSWNESAAQRASVPPAQAQKYKALWGKVPRLIKTIASVRRQERRDKGGDDAAEVSGN